MLSVRRPADLGEGAIVSDHDVDRPLKRWNLRDLLSYPTQRTYFENLSDVDLARLADDIDRNGLRSAIEVLGENTAGLPRGTILSGHQRKRALLSLGKKNSTVIVRNDLRDATPAEIERLFLEANLNRRQMHPLDKARSVLRLFEIERARRRGESVITGEARDRVGKAIGVSGRTVSRYLGVLRTSAAVQAAFRSGQLSLV
jgi:ParB-like chromosome segregation protein Spo0J